MENNRKVSLAQGRSNEGDLEIPEIQRKLKHFFFKSNLIHDIFDLDFLASILCETSEEKSFENRRVNSEILEGEYSGKTSLVGIPNKIPIRTQWQPPCHFEPMHKLVQFELNIKNNLLGYMNFLISDLQDDIAHSIRRHKFVVAGRDEPSKYIIAAH